ncbi:helix-turn-helix transcriptional regulator [Pedobacter sp. PAMC26386]|nr:helix-turn-helix transcriptional regulator [Pedobacter sp. PAMC26386]
MQQDLKIIGARFKSFREANVGNQADLAKELGVNVKTISFIENGHVAPGAVYLSYLAEKHSLNMEWMMKGLGDEKKFLKTDPKSIANLHAKIILMEKELEEMKNLIETILEKLK